MRVLVCGGRDFDDSALVKRILDQIHAETPITSIIHGAARGADSLGKFWAQINRLPHKAFPADWDEYKKRAGYLRNQQMLDEGKPDLVVAFPDGKGTQMMIDITLESGRCNVVRVAPAPHWL